MSSPDASEPRPGDLPRLSAQEEALLRGPLSGPPHDPALTRDETLPAIFAETVARHAQRPAVSEDGRMLSLSLIHI